MSIGEIRLPDDKKICSLCGGRKYKMMYDVSNDVWEKRPCTLCKGTGFVPFLKTSYFQTNNTGPR